MVISDLNVGLLYVLALSSVGVYGVALGGWASNSKYALLGGIRGAAQMISYELSLGLSLVPVVMLAGSFSLVDIVTAQARYPFILVQPLAFIIFFISAVAEIKRIPFDLPEAENELIAGYHTEYSGMRFGLYFLGEYVTMVILGALVAVFFLGGWRGPLLPPLVWFLPQGLCGDCLRHDLDPGHPAPAALRPAHAPGLEGPDPPGPAQHHRDRGRHASGGWLTWIIAGIFSWRPGRLWPGWRRASASPLFTCSANPSPRNTRNTSGRSPNAPGPASSSPGTRTATSAAWPATSAPRPAR